MQHTVIAKIGLEARHKIDLAIRPGFLAFHIVQGEIAQDAFEHIVPAGRMAAYEARRMRKRRRVVLGDMAFLLGVADEGVEIVADDFGHAGGRDGDHVRLVKRNRVFQPVEHILLTAEDGCVLGHGIRHAGNRFLEVPVEIGAEIGNAALASVNIGKRLLETERAEHGP